MATLWRYYSGQTCASAPPAPNSVETSPEKERIREIKENMHANSKRSRPKTRRKMTPQNTKYHPAVIKMKRGKCVLFLPLMFPYILSGNTLNTVNSNAINLSPRHTWLDGCDLDAAAHCFQSQSLHQSLHKKLCSWVHSQPSKNLMQTHERWTSFRIETGIPVT